MHISKIVSFGRYAFACIVLLWCTTGGSGGGAVLFAQEIGEEPPVLEQDAAQEAQPAEAQPETVQPEEEPSAEEETEDDQWFLDKPITDIEFRGLTVTRPSDLTAVTNQFIDRPFTFALLQDIQRRLYALDYFSELTPTAEDVDPRGTRREEVRIVFAVVENPIVDSIEFDGNQRLSNGLLREEVVLKVGDIVTPVKLRSEQAALIQLYKARGFPDVEISYDVEYENEGSARQIVRFIIEENQQLVVQSITFDGNNSLSNAALTGVMMTKQQSLFNRGELDPLGLEQDKQLLEAHYQSKGYIDAQIIDIEENIIESDDDDNRVYYELHVIIDEGPQFMLGTIEFFGNEIYDTEELTEVLQMKEGDLLDLRRFEADYQRVVNLYYDNGYIFNTILQNELRSEEQENIVSFRIDIVERPRAHIENIIIRGNTKTKDRVILRELPFETGEVFNASQVRRGILNLYNLQFFGNVLPETPLGSEEGLMDLIINVEEGQTADIRFGFAFGGTSDFPVSLQLGWQDRNFLGNGHTFGADIIATFSQQRISLNFVEPWLADQRVSLGVNLDLSHTVVSGLPQDILPPIFDDTDTDAVPDPFTGQYVFRNDTTYNGQRYRAGEPFPTVPTQEQINDNGLVTDYVFAGGSTAAIPTEYLLTYDIWSAQLGVSTGYRIPTAIGQIRIGGGVSTNLEYIDYNSDVYRPFDPLVRNGLHTVGLINRLFVRASLDDRDLFYNPSSGYYLAQVFTLTGGFLFGDRHYIRSDSRGELHLTLFDVPVSEAWNFKFVLGIQSLFSLILPQFYIPEEFADNPQPVASSQDLLYLDGVFFGRGWPRELDGEALWDSIVELKMPLAEQIIWLDLFFEAAALWQDVDSITGTTLEENLRFTFGGGIRFTIPQFPIRLYLAKRFRVRNGVVEWEPGAIGGNPNDPLSGVDFVFTIGVDLL